jgi:phasin family protein
MEMIMKATQENTAKQVEAGMKSATAQMEKAATMSKDTVEAVVQSSTIVAKGCEEMSKNIWSWMQSSVEQSMTTSKQVLGVKTLRELVDLQTAFMRGMMDQSLTETTKLTEIGTRVAGQAIEPINQRVNTWVETISSVRAA